MVDRLQHEQVITAYLDSAVDKTAETMMVDTIRTTVGAHAEVEMVQPEQFVNHLRADYPELSRELEDLGPEMVRLFLVMFRLPESFPIRL